MDDLKINLAKIANWVHALMAMLVDPRFSNGAKFNPHSTDRAVQPDIVRLGLHSSLTAYEMSSLVRDALAILLLALCQSLDLRKKAAPRVELGG